MRQGKVADINFPHVLESVEEMNTVASTPEARMTERLNEN